MGTLKAYQLPLASIPQGESDRAYTLDTEFFRAMEQCDVLAADVHVDLHVDHRNDAYRLLFRLKGSIDIPCDRCLEPMAHAVDVEEPLTVKYGEEEDDSTDGLLVVPESLVSLDLAPLLCDMVLLSIPMRHIHPEGGCDPAMSRILADHSVEEAGEDEPDEIQ